MFDFAEFIKNERKNQGIRQTYLAEKANLHVNTLQRLEAKCNLPTVFVVNKFLNALGYELTVVRIEDGKTGDAS